MKHSGETGLKDAKPEAPEYGFEKGLEEITSRILELLRREKYVVVAFSCSSTNVGKSTLAKLVAQKLFKNGITAERYHGLEEIGEDNTAPRGDSRVFIFEQLEWHTVNIKQYTGLKIAWDRAIKKTFDKVGIGVRGADLWVGIYRPDKPFELGSNSRPLADIIIRNDLAVNKE